MNFKYIAIVGVIATALLGTAAFATDSAFAYEKNQANSQELWPKVGDWLRERS